MPKHKRRFSQSEKAGKTQSLRRLPQEFMWWPTFCVCTLMHINVSANRCAFCLFGNTKAWNVPVSLARTHTCYSPRCCTHRDNSGLWQLQKVPLLVHYQSGVIKIHTAHLAIRPLPNKNPACVMQNWMKYLKGRVGVRPKCWHSVIAFSDNMRCVSCSQLLFPCQPWQRGVKYPYFIPCLTCSAPQHFSFSKINL